MDEPPVGRDPVRIAAPRWHWPTLLAGAVLFVVGAAALDSPGRLLCAVAVLGLLGTAWLQRPGPLLQLDAGQLCLRSAVGHQRLSWGREAQARPIASRRGARPVALEFDPGDGSLPGSVALWRLDAVPDLLLQAVLDARS